MRLFSRAERAPRRDAVPFGEARSTATGGGVLRDERRMAAHRRLPAVIGRIGRREAIANEGGGVIQHRVQPAITQIGEILFAKAEAAAKSGTGQGDEQRIKVTHGACHMGLPRYIYPDNRR